MSTRERYLMLLKEVKCCGQVWERRNLMRHSTHDHHATEKGKAMATDETTGDGEMMLGNFII